MKGESESTATLQSAWPNYVITETRAGRTGSPTVAAYKLKSTYAITRPIVTTNPNLMGAEE